MKKLLLILLCLPMLGFGQDYGYYCDTTYVSMQASTSQPIHSLTFTLNYTTNNGWYPGSDPGDLYFGIQNAPVISGNPVGSQSWYGSNSGSWAESFPFQIDPLIMDTFQVNCDWWTPVNNNFSFASCSGRACFAWDGSNWNNIGYCTVIQTAIQEYTTNKELLKVTDLLGRETKQTNQPLFYIYDDGTVEKRIVIE
jgi:hypothetical protein